MLGRLNQKFPNQLAIRSSPPNQRSRDSPNRKRRPSSPPNRNRNRRSKVMRSFKLQSQLLIVGCESFKLQSGRDLISGWVMNPGQIRSMIVDKCSFIPNEVCNSNLIIVPHPYCKPENKRRRGGFPSTAVCFGIASKLPLLPSAYYRRLLLLFGFFSVVAYHYARQNHYDCLESTKNKAVPKIKCYRAIRFWLFYCVDM